MSKYQIQQDHLDIIEEAAKSRKLVVEVKSREYSTQVQIRQDFTGGILVAQARIGANCGRQTSKDLLVELMQELLFWTERAKKKTLN
jgi:hypothetical protein